MLVVDVVVLGRVCVCVCVCVCVQGHEKMHSHACASVQVLWSFRSACGGLPCGG